jgi:hypothetical protein
MAINPGRRRSASRHPGAAPFLISVTAALAAAQVFWLFPLDHGRSITEAGAPAAKLTAMTINSEFGQAEAAGIVRLVRENGVGLLTVQEHSRALEDRLAAAGLSGLLPYRISAPTADGGGSAIYSAHRLEAVGVLPDTPFHMPIVRLTVEGAGAPAVLEVTNVHALPPVDVRVDQWRSDLAALARLSVRPGNRLPGIAIDHLVTSPGIAASGYAVHRVPGTDHAAVLATLSLPTGR